VFDKELLTIIDAFKYWEVQLRGAMHPVIVYSDYKNLIGFMTTKRLNRRQIRWAELMMDYDFKIKY
jgi:hypothetical protein